MTTLLLDLKHTARALRRSPLMFASAALSIAIGVGANTAVFSWMDSLVLRPFPGVREPERVVGIETKFPTGGEGPSSFPSFREWREGSRSFTGMAAWTFVRVSARQHGAQTSQSRVSLLVSGEYFHVLGGGAHLGRTLQWHDEELRAPVAVLGYSAWLRDYAGDASVIGRTIYMNGAPFSIVGVAEPHFVGTYLGVVPDVFVPITLQPSLTGVNALEDRGARGYQIVARLAPGVTVQAAARETDELARRLSAEHGDRPALGAYVVESRMQFLGGLVQPLFSATLVVTALLLSIACANVAGLLLVRAAARWGELSLRVALGASARQIGRLVVLESLLLAICGGALGVAIAYFARGVIASFIPTTTFPIVLPIDINGRVLLFALATAGIVTAICAVAPAWRASRLTPANALRGGSGGPAGRTSRVRFGIVAGQIALSFTCLVSAGLFLRGLRSASKVDVGFADPARVLLVNTDLSAARLTDSLAVSAMRDILRRVRAMPGVQRASLATFVPLGFGGRRVNPVRVDGYTPAPQEDMSVLRIIAAGEYASTMRIDVVDGRDFNDTDRASSQPVALVNQTFAERFWPGASAIGRRIDNGRGWATVVGVLRDGKYGTLAEKSQPVVYLPIEQWPAPSFVLHLRSAADPLLFVAQTTKALQAVHVDLPALQPRSLAEHISAQTVIPEVGGSVLSVFGVIALGLAGLGLYAAISYAAALRSRELGVRLALGAERRQVVGVVVRPAVLMVVVGFSLGAALSTGLGRLLMARMPMLSGASPWDPIIYGGSLCLMLVVAVASAWLPARRALRIDPVSVLRDA